ncbi:MAG: hypothetical protein AB7S41_00695 [Parvibaculaceae bacterium]
MHASGSGGGWWDRRNRRASLLLMLHAIRIWALPVALAIALLAVFAVILWERPVASRMLEGTVEGWSRDQTEQGSGRIVVTVRTSDGAQLTAFASPAFTPVIGARIGIEEYATSLGRRKYRVRPNAKLD